MPNENAGRADKSGNRYETRVVILHLLELLEEKYDYVTLEALGDDEQGVDLWIGHRDGTKEGIQCKSRNGSSEHWDFGSANSKNIFSDWKAQLSRDPSICVSLASPLTFTFLEDLIERAIKSNDNGYDFFMHQVLSSSKKFISFVKNVCRAMNIDYNSNYDLIRFIDYLNRIRYHQLPDNNLKRIIFSKIEYLFIGNAQSIYNSLVTLIFDGEILGKNISISMLCAYLKENEINLKNLALDSRIFPRITQLNREYEMFFNPLNNGLIVRDEFEKCKNAIKNGHSLIIHGKAGRGKSGCTENIIDHCKTEEIPYLAVKLDKRIPSCNAEKWGIDLGLPASIVHCIHSIAKKEKAVIILDQLDALRWTQAHSRDALLVCSQIIEQVTQLNLERQHNISIVYVCRTYDFENDNNIKGIFKTDKTVPEKLKWDKILISEMNDNVVQKIVGIEYSKLTTKLKELLRIPSNLYIWQNLDHTIEYNECATTNHLVSEWWNQLSLRYADLGHSESELNNTKYELVKQFDQLGRICIPANVVSSNYSILRYLSSNGFLILQENKVSFAHQSILDCLLAENMLRQYFSGDSVISIIGSKEKQTPGRRYQLQMFMQNLVELESQIFIDVGLQILKCKGVRFSNKYVFFEILNQVDEVDSSISNFIIKNCSDKPWSKHLIYDVIYSKANYYRVLRDSGVIETWFQNSDKKEIVFKLLASIRPNYDTEDVEFIAQHMFKLQEDDYNFAQCFYRDINEDSDELFELRLQFYRKYPQFANTYLDFKSMMNNCELRTIRYLALLLENKSEFKRNNIKKYEAEFLYEDTEFLIQYSETVLKLLLPYIPINNDDLHTYSKWSGIHNSSSIERVCVSILKKANAAMILENPNLFWNYYSSYFKLGNYLFNELILDAFIKLPLSFSDCILSCLSNNFDNLILDKTSGNRNELSLVKEVIKKHIESCSKEVYLNLEENIINYISPDSVSIYKRRISTNKEDNGYTVYWSFWGDLQYELLSVIPIERLSIIARNLLQVLNRKFSEGTNRYTHSSILGGSVISPISGRKLTDKNWLSIISNKKLKNKKTAPWKKVPEGFCESSIEMFANDFCSAVSENPERMLKFALSQHESIDDKFIDSLFNGIAYSNHLDILNNVLIERMILQFPCDNKSYRASYICTILEKKKDSSWSQDIIDVLTNIAIHHHDPEIENSNASDMQDKDINSIEMLQNTAFNSVRGHAANAIASLLWSNPEYFNQFKDTIDHLTNDVDPAVRLASISTLCPIYNIDKKWASEKTLKIIEDDYRLSGHHNMRNIFFYLYPEYRTRVLSLIRKCYESDYADLVMMGALSLSEMYIRNNEFNNEMSSISTMSNKQAEGILLIAMLYFNKHEYNELAKDIIIKFSDSELDIEIPLARLFYDDLILLDRDSEFLINIMGSDIGRKTVHAFVHYLEEESHSLIEYKDIILSMSQNILSCNVSSKEKSFGIGDELSKLIIGLYDEVSDSNESKYMEISNQCLDLWDLMFENQIGSTRKLSQEIMQR